MPAPRKLVSFLVIALAVVAALALGLWVRSGQSTQKVGRPPIGGLECGQWAVFRTCELLGIPVSPGVVVDMMPSGPNGHSLKEIADVLRHAGLVTRGRKESFDLFLSNEGIRIVHLLSPDHFIVVTRSGPDLVFFFDDQGRRQGIPCSVLRERWSGHVLYVERPPPTHSIGFVQRDPSDGKPQIQFEALFVDKGDIPTTGGSRTVQFNYPFRNAGKSDLLIKKVHTNCSCLVAEKPEHPIAPGSTGFLKLHYSIDKRKGSFLHEAAVETNDPFFPVIILRAAGNTNALVLVSPPALDLGIIPLGEERRAFLIVRYTGDESFTVQEVTSSLSSISLKLHETTCGEFATKIWPGSHGSIQLSNSFRILEVSVSSSGRSVGELKSEVSVATNINGYEKITVPVKAKLVSPVAVVPSVLSFSEINPGETSERSLSLFSLVNKPIRVVAVMPESAGLEWSAAHSADDSKRIQLRVSADGAALHKLSGSSLGVRIELDGNQVDLAIPVLSGKHPDQR